MKKIKFTIPACNYKIEHKKSVLFPEKLELVKITLGNRIFTPNQKIVVDKNTRIPIIDIYNKNLFTEKTEKGG